MRGNEQNGAPVGGDAPVEGDEAAGGESDPYEYSGASGQRPAAEPVPERADQRMGADA